MMSNARRYRLAPRAALLLAAAVALSACGATIGKLPETLGGLPEHAPQRPAETMPYPNVYEQRPTRDAKPLSGTEQKDLESELTKLRDNQNQRATVPDGPPPAPPKDAAQAKKPATKAPAKAAAPAKKEPSVPLKLTN